MELNFTIFLAVILLLSFGCVSEDTKESESDPPLDLQNLEFVSTVPKSDVIPDVVYNYLSDFRYPDSLLLDTTILFVSAESLNTERNRLRKLIREYAEKEESLPEYAESNLTAVNQAFTEYALYKMLRDLDDTKTLKEFGQISILIRRGRTTVKPAYLADIMDSFPEEVKSTPMWKEKRILLNPREIVGLSLYDLPESQVYTREKKARVGFHDVLMESSAPTVLVFTASWCAPCKVDYDRNRDSFHKLEKTGVRVLSYSLDRNLDQWRRILNEADYITECYCDTEGFDSPVANSLGIVSIPAYVLLNEKGVIDGIYSPSTIKEMFDL